MLRLCNLVTQQAASSPPRHELIVRVCQTTVGIVVFNGESQVWEWMRLTTRVLQGASPAAGSSNRGLADAKAQLVRELVKRYGQ